MSNVSRCVSPQTFFDPFEPTQMRIVEKLEKRVSAAHELGQLQKLVEASRYVEDEARD